MLQAIRERTRGIVGWTIIGAIALVMSIFGFGALNFFVESAPVVAEVGGTEVSQAQYDAAVEAERERRRNEAEEAGEQAPEEQSDEALRQRTLLSLIDRALLAEAVRLSRLAVSDAAVDRTITREVNFQIDGRFNADLYRRILAINGYTPPRHRELVANSLLVGQIVNGIQDSTFYTLGDLASVVALAYQRRDLAWMKFLPEDYQSQQEVDAAQIESFYEANLDRYNLPEQVWVEYLVINQADLAAEQEITDELLEQAYADEVATYEGQEQRDASHILVAVNDERTLDQAQERMSEIIRRLDAGQDFAALAQEYSDDPGSGSRGGSLGFAIRGAYVKPFEDALFALEQGELSAPVVSEFGVHIIRCDDIAQTMPPTFDQSRDRLTGQLRADAADEAFARLRSRLETIAYEAPDLTEPAQLLGQEIMQEGPISRGLDALQSGVFARPEVVAAAFSDEVLVDGYNSEVLEPDVGVALVLRVTNHEPARLQSLAEVEQTVRDHLVAEQAVSMAVAAADAALAQLQAGEDWQQVAQETGHEWTSRSGQWRQDGSTVADSELVQQAFQMPHPAPDTPTLARVLLEQGGAALLRLTRVYPGDLASVPDADREQMEAVVLGWHSDGDMQVFLDAMRRDTRIRKQDS